MPRRSSLPVSPPSQQPTLLTQMPNPERHAAPGRELVLTDYGVERVARGGVDEASYYGTAGGTVAYMAPELLDERHTKHSRRM